MKSRVIFFQSAAGERIAGTFHEPARPGNAGVVLGHCFTCSRHTSILKDLADAVTERGIMALRFDFSGNGQSTGDFRQTTYTRHRDEMRRAVAELTSMGIDRIGLAGHSMGASIALMTATVLPETAAVCALAGRLDGGSAADLFSREQQIRARRAGEIEFISRGRRLRLGKDFFEDAIHHDPRRILRDMSAPLLVVHGEADEIIPVSAAYGAVRLCPDAELMILPGVDHMFLDKERRKSAAEHIAAWFQRKLGM